MIYYHTKLKNLVPKYKALIERYELIVAEGEIARINGDYTTLQEKVESANELRRDEIMPCEKKLDILTNLVKLEVEYADAA